jgi:hypothetical protein
MTVASVSSSLTEIVAELEGFVAQTAGAVRRLADTAEDSLRTEPLRRADLDVIEPLVAEILGDSDVTVHGAGFVAAPGLLSDAQWWLEWFAWEGQRIQRLVPETNPQGAHFFDYTLMPWYSGPESGAGPTITGPYVDYLCTDDYTLTFTEAVFDGHGSFAGVVGADVRVIAVEERFLPMLRRDPQRLAIVNQAGRIVVSNSAQLLSGNLVEEVDVPSLFVERDPTLYRVGQSELAVLALGSR